MASHEDDALSPQYSGIDDTSLPGSPEDVSGWVGIGWFLAVCLASAIVAALALPPAAHRADLADAVEYQWLVLATLLVWPIQRCARRSVICGLLAFVVAIAWSVYIVAAGLERASTDRLLHPAAELWYVVPVVQLVLFAGFMIAGTQQRIRDLRWKRLTAALMGDARQEPRRRGWALGSARGSK